jgi:ribosome-associated protein
MAEKRAKTARSAKSAGKKTAAKSRAPAKKAASKVAKTSGKVAAMPRKPKRETLLDVVERALDDMKAVNVRVLDVRKLTDIADTMIVASGNSDRHVRSIADRVVEFAKKAGYRPMGVEGEREGEWVLVCASSTVWKISGTCVRRGAKRLGSKPPMRG